MDRAIQPASETRAHTSNTPLRACTRILHWHTLLCRSRRHSARSPYACRRRPPRPLSTSSSRPVLPVRGPPPPPRAGPPHSRSCRLSRAPSLGRPSRDPLPSQPRALHEAEAGQSLRSDSNSGPRPCRRGAFAASLRPAAVATASAAASAACGLRCAPPARTRRTPPARPPSGCLPTSPRASPPAWCAPPPPRRAGSTSAAPRRPTAPPGSSRLCAAHCPPQTLRRLCAARRRRSRRTCRVGAARGQRRRCGRRGGAGTATQPGGRGG